MDPDDEDIEYTDDEVEEFGEDDEYESDFINDDPPKYSEGIRFEDLPLEKKKEFAKDVKDVPGMEEFSKEWGDIEEEEEEEEEEEQEQEGEYIPDEDDNIEDVEYEKTYEKIDETPLASKFKKFTPYDLLNICLEYNYMNAIKLLLQKNSKNNNVILSKDDLIKSKKKFKSKINNDMTYILNYYIDKY
jgi:hypothetical protein